MTSFNQPLCCCYGIEIPAKAVGFSCFLEYDSEVPDFIEFTRNNRLFLSNQNRSFGARTRNPIGSPKGSSSRPQTGV